MKPKGTKGRVCGSNTFSLKSEEKKATSVAILLNIEFYRHRPAAQIYIYIYIYIYI